MVTVSLNGQSAERKILKMSITIPTIQNILYGRDLPAIFVLNRPFWEIIAFNQLIQCSENLQKKS